MLHVDSIQRDFFRFGSKELAALRHWLSCETSRLLKLPYHSESFRQRLLQLQDLSAWSYCCRNSPRQDNSDDCGVFYLMNMIYTLQRRLPVFLQHDILFFRQQLFTAIVHNALPDLRTPLSSNDTPFHIPRTQLSPLAALPHTRYSMAPPDRRLLFPPYSSTLPHSPPSSFPLYSAGVPQDTPAYPLPIFRTLYDPLKYPP